MDMEKIIIINSGSVSKKYALYEGERKIVVFHYESTKDGYLLTEKVDGVMNRSSRIKDSDYKKAFSHFIESILSQGKIKDKKEKVEIKEEKKPEKPAFVPHKIKERKVEEEKYTGIELGKQRTKENTKKRRKNGI